MSYDREMRTHDVCLEVAAMMLRSIVETRPHPYISEKAQAALNLIEGIRIDRMEASAPAEKKPREPWPANITEAMERQQAAEEKGRDAVEELVWVRGSIPGATREQDDRIRAAVSRAIASIRSERAERELAREVSAGRLRDLRTAEAELRAAKERIEKALAIVVAYQSGRTGIYLDVDNLRRILS